MTLPCPSEDELAAFAGAGLPAGGRDAVLAHLDGCEACRRIVAALAADDAARDGDAGAGAGAAGDGAATGDDGGAADDRGAIGRYRLLGALGAGAMGVVFAAHDPELDRRVALKLLHREHGGDHGRRLEARLVAEARTLARLAHPNVIAAYEVGRHDGEVFLAMELVEGATLASWRDAAPRSITEIVAVFAQAGAGLAAAHAAGIVHRDVKPDNILVGDDGRVRVTDFGLASGAILPDRAIGDAGGVALTRTGALVGTPAYMAPEQLDGGAATAASDQFGFCVALWEALYGVRPFGGDSVRALRAAMDAPPRRPAGGGSRAAAARADPGLAASPAARWPRLDDLLGAIERFGRPRSHRVRIAAGVATVAVVTAAAVAATRAPTVAAPRCDAGAAQLAGLWSPARAGAVRDRMIAIAGDRGAHVFAVMDAELTRWTRAWADEHDDACRATYQRHEQSHAVHEARARCLDRLRRRADVLVGLYADAAIDAEMIERAPEAAQSLAAPASCALADDDPAPADPTLRAAEDRLQGRLAEADALRVVGQRDASRLAADDVEREAAQLGLVRVRMAALVARAAGESLAGGGQDLARADYRAAADLAMQLRDDGTLADALTGIGYASVYAGDFGEAETAAELSRAAIRRLGGDPGREADVAIVRCIRAARLGRDLAAARASCDGAADAVRAAGGDADVRRSWVANEVGNIAYLDGRYDDAARAYQESIDQVEGIYGPGHPSADATISNRAQAWMRMGRLADAEAALREVLGRRPEWGDSWDGLAAVLRRRGDAAGAMDAARHAIASARQAGQRQVEQYAAVGLAEAALDGRDVAEARRAVAAARDVTEATAMPVDQARLELVVARLYAHDGDRARARAAASDALAAIDASGTAARGPSAEIRAEIATFQASLPAP
ncbi:MAG: serine/threonine protein kinase [Kofleriaceae bacterium]|nr:serine/threonine protein kinase [Kofleriaceae bacterium]